MQCFCWIIQHNIYRDIINGTLVLQQNINGTPVNFNGTLQVYANYNRDTINHFSVKCLLNLEFDLTMVSFFFFPFPFLLPGLLPWLLQVSETFKKINKCKQLTLAYLRWDFTRQQIIRQIHGLSVSGKPHLKDYLEAQLG